MEAKEIISSGLLELYATGLASANEAIQVEKYVAAYPEVAGELSNIINSLEIYANSFAVQPDVSVKDKIFARISNASTNNVFSSKTTFLDDSTDVFHKNSEAGKLVNINSYWKYIAAASIFLLLGSIALNISLYNKESNIKKVLNQNQEELFSLKAESKLLESDMQVVQNKYSRPVSLRGLKAAPNAAAKIFWIENTGELYIDPSNLPVAPAGKQYQLWGIVDGKPVDAGMIRTIEIKDKFRIQKMKSFGRAEAFAVTLENETGNKAPKGPMFVMGKM